MISSSSACRLTALRHHQVCLGGTLTYFSLHNLTYAKFFIPFILIGCLNRSLAGKQGE